MYRCFTRTWWKDNPDWPNGLEPHAGRKKYRKDKTFQTLEEAREFCMDWNDNHDAGRYSYKMEFESEL